jgi:tetratricopeptide (TPR) repeat protein
MRLQTALALLLLAALLVTAGSLHSNLADIRAGYPDEFRSYYVPSSQYMKVASLGQRNLWADLIFVWAVQYFDRYGDEVRGTYLYRTFDTLTDLDPRFYEAYIFGCLFLSLDQRWDSLFRLADKGIAFNSDNWLLPWEAGTYAFFQARDYDQASRYFQIAHDRNPQEILIKDMLANSLKYRGDYERSLEFWTKIRAQFEGVDTPRGRFFRLAADRNIFDLRVKMDLKRLGTAVDAYSNVRGTRPQRLSDLVQAGLLPGVPMDPYGEPYLYDPATGEVTCSRPFNFRGAYGQW